MAELRNWITKSMHKLAQALIALVLLQFAAANLGGHQLHAGNSAEEESEHAHLQYVAKVETLAQCIDCVCESDTLDTQSQSEHQHLVTELKQVDLCLDCQCHGGVVSMLSYMSALPDSQPDFISPFSDTPYLPPLVQPDYRPPIA
ncbi:hypothetical protein [Shewanella sp. GXUN23E]|uniref:hypothetical protein n=1 Tax=Shewanella sp. GXUN23E TaxID=3422498 RepID=UPI003D7DC166